MARFNVKVRENNSGGSFVLSHQNYADLARKGWKIDNAHDLVGYVGELSRTVLADNVEMALGMAISQFEAITGRDIDADNWNSCSCCGERWYFTAEGKSREIVQYSPEIAPDPYY